MHQDDQAYAPAGWRFGDSKLGVSFARLRTVDGSQHVFTVKRPAENALSCVEFECTVSDRDAMHQAILTMGFTPTVRIVKARRTATVAGMSVCVDDVDGAGVFLEVERMMPAGETIDGVQSALAAFVDSLEMQAERTIQTYDSILHGTVLS